MPEGGAIEGGICAGVGGGGLRATTAAPMSMFARSFAKNFIVLCVFIRHSHLTYSSQNMFHKGSSLPSSIMQSFGRICLASATPMILPCDRYLFTSIKLDVICLAMFASPLHMCFVSHF